MPKCVLNYSSSRTSNAHFEIRYGTVESLFTHTHAHRHIQISIFSETTSDNMNYAPVGDNEEFTTEQSRDTDRFSRCIRSLDCTTGGVFFYEAFASCFAGIWGGIVYAVEGCGDCCSGCCSTCGDCMGDCCQNCCS
jgi:hypothetical protein